MNSYEEFAAEVRKRNRDALPPRPFPFCQLAAIIIGIAGYISTLFR